MKLDTTALGTFHEMAREGAGIAATRLTGIAGVETRVGVTKLNFMRGMDIRSELAAGGEKVGVQVELTGAIEGHSLVVFDADSARRVVDAVMPDDEGDLADLDRSATTEVGQMINSGFVDGWADVLETAIDVSTPEYVSGEDPQPFLEGVEVTADEDLAILFRSRIEAVGEEISFNHYLFPDHDSMEALLDRLRGDGAVIEYDKLAAFDRLAQRGAREVAENVTTMTGFDTEIELRRLNFVPMAAIPEELGARQLIGVAFEFDGLPSGYLVFLFDEESAETAVDAMVPTAPDDPFGEMGQSALQELGNIMASGFLDGWANVLDTNIDHSTPEYVRDVGAAVIDPIAIQLGENQDFAFAFDTRVIAADREFDCDILAVPDESDLERALAELDVDRIEDEPIKADFPIDEA